jgi:hypothetical protein
MADGIPRGSIDIEDMHNGVLLGEEIARRRSIKIAASIDVMSLM